MPYKKQQRWIEAQHSARVITLAWTWVGAVVLALLTFLAMVHWLVPALFLWIIFGPTGG